MDVQKLMDQLKETIKKFNLQTDVMNSMNEKVATLEQRILDMAYTGDKPKYLGEWNSDKHAKGFVEFITSVFRGDVKTSHDPMSSTDDAGGYMIPDEFVPTLVRLIETYGLIRRSATIIPMSRNELKMPNLTGGIKVYWPGENVAVTKTTIGSGNDMAFGQVQLVVKKLAALVPASSELLEDSSIAIANLLAILVAEAMAKEEDRVGLFGSVAAVGTVIAGGDPFNGIGFAPGSTTVELAEDAGMNTITADDLLDVIDQTPSSAQPNAKFVMHRTVFSVLRKLKSAPSGEYIYDAPSGIHPATIWGYPFELNDVMPNVGGAIDTMGNDAAHNIPFILFGDLKHLYLGDRKKMSVAISTHVGFAEDEVFFRYIERLAMTVAIPGAYTTLNRVNIVA